MRRRVPFFTHCVPCRAVLLCCAVLCRVLCSSRDSLDAVVCCLLQCQAFVVYALVGLSMWRAHGRGPCQGLPVLGRVRREGACGRARGQGWMCAVVCSSCQAQLKCRGSSVGSQHPPCCVAVLCCVMTCSALGHGGKGAGGAAGGLPPGRAAAARGRNGSGRCRARCVCGWRPGRWHRDRLRSSISCPALFVLPCCSGCFCAAECAVHPVSPCSPCNSTRTYPTAQCIIIITYCTVCVPLATIMSERSLPHA